MPPEVPRVLKKLAKPVPSRNRPARQTPGDGKRDADGDEGNEYGEQGIGQVLAQETLDHEGDRDGEKDGQDGLGVGPGVRG